MLRAVPAELPGTTGIPTVEGFAGSGAAALELDAAFGCSAATASSDTAEMSIGYSDLPFWPARGAYSPGVSALTARYFVRSSPDISRNL